MADDLQSKAMDLMKKALAVGIGGLFLTEENLRNLVSEFKLPKELLSGLLESAHKTKKEFLENFSKELLSRLAGKLNPEEFLHEFFQKNEIDLRVRIRFSPKQKNTVRE